MLPMLTRSLLSKTSPAFTALASVRGLHAARSHLAATTTVAKSHEGAHWKAEKIVAAGLLATIPAAVVGGPTMAVDMAMAGLISSHIYSGMNSVIVDYVHGGFTKPVLAIWAGVSACTFGSLVYFNYKDVGITKGIKMLWSL